MRPAPSTTRQRVPSYPGLLRPMWVAADWIGRPRATLRTWYRRGQLVPRACHVATKALLVDLTDVLDLDAAARRRENAELTDRDL